MKQKKSDNTKQSNSDRAPSSQKDVVFFSVLSVLFVMLSVGVLVSNSISWLGGSEAIQKQYSKKDAEETDPVSNKEIDPQLQDISFEEDKKVQLVVGYTTPNSGDVLKELQSDEYRITRYYWNKPVFGLAVTESGYNKLLISPMVDTIHLYTEDQAE